MKAAIITFHASVLVVALCCHSYSQTNGKRAYPGLSVKDKVRECVFRYQFSKFGGSDREGKKHFFVGIGYYPQDDPSPGLIRKLQSSAYSVKGVSQCIRSTGGVFDAKTRTRGLAFFVTDVKSISSSRAQAQGSFFSDGKGGNEALYTTNNIKGRWQVVKCQITAVH